MNIRDLPTLNAVLNAISFCLLITGYLFIRRRNRLQHKRFMLGAFAASTLFLASYLVYHTRAGSVSFTGQGWIRLFYFFVLLTHILLAALILPLALATLRRALKGDFAGHARVARRTLPLWLYVSLTGVLIYWLLYVA